MGKSWPIVMLECLLAPMLGAEEVRFDGGNVEIKFGPHPDGWTSSLIVPWDTMRVFPGKYIRLGDEYEPEKAGGYMYDHVIDRLVHEIRMAYHRASHKLGEEEDRDALCRASEEIIRKLRGVGA